MAHKKQTISANLLDFMLKTALITDFGTLPTNGVKKLAAALVERYGEEEARRQWPTYRELVLKIARWCRDNARPELPWRDSSLCLADALNLTSRLVIEPRGVTDAQFETELIGWLQTRQQNLHEWTAELWRQESLIRYALDRGLQTQAYASGLDVSDVDLAFSEKFDTILLTYDPVLAGHASLKTYAVTVVYRHLLDKLRRLNYSGLSLSGPADEQVETNLLELVFEQVDKSTDYNLATEGLAVCQRTLEELEKPGEFGSNLSQTRIKLIYFDLLKMMLNEVAESSLTLSQASQLLLRNVSISAGSPGIKVLQFANQKNATLQTLSDGLQLQVNKTANRVQLSQARRILISRLALLKAIDRFVEVSPYQTIYKEHLKQSPLKIMDYCFVSLNRFYKLLNY